MQQSSLHNARNLSAAARQALEQLLGRPLSDSETISVRAYQPQEAPPVEQRRAIASELRRYFARVDERAQGVTETERDEIFDEAIRSVRQEYQPAR